MGTKKNYKIVFPRKYGLEVDAEARNLKSPILPKSLST